MVKKIVLVAILVSLLVVTTSVSAADIKDEPVVNSPKIPPIGG